MRLGLFFFFFYFRDFFFCFFVLLGWLAFMEGGRRGYIYPPHPDPQ